MITLLIISFLCLSLASTALVLCACYVGGREVPRQGGIWLEPVGSHETNPFAKKEAPRP